MDKKTKLIRKTVITPANILDFKSTEEALVGDEKEVYGDRGYAPVRKYLKDKYPNLLLKIMYKRQRAKKGCKSELDKIKSYSNKIFAKERLMHDEKEFNFAFLRQDAGNGK